MKIDIDPDQFLYTGERAFDIGNTPTTVGKLYEDKGDYRDKMGEFREEIDDLQQIMYAHDRYAMLLVFQAMDAAGKDGTIRHVMSGVNPHCRAAAPSQFSTAPITRRFWSAACTRKLSAAASVCRPSSPRTSVACGSSATPTSAAWRRTTITTAHAFWEKNWKFEEGDLAERKHWDEYQTAYEDAINATATPESPWFVIPADDKQNMRLIVAQIILRHLRELDMCYPELDAGARGRLAGYHKQLKSELDA